MLENLAFSRLSPSLVEPQVAPFFLKARVPKPTNHLESTSRLKHLQEEIFENWEYAERDFHILSSTQAAGQQIQDLFSAQGRGLNLRLMDGGRIIGIDSPHKANKVRQALNVGEISDKGTHIGEWKFTEKELAQFLIGLLAFKEKETYEIIRVNIENQMKGIA